MPIINESGKTIGRKYLEEKGSKFKDIKKGGGQAGEAVLQNVVLSSKPCPDCAAANGEQMTFKEWEESEFGLPGSSGRICEDDCHCILVPVDQIDGLPEIGEQIKLRGDKDSDIGSAVDIGPNEASLKEAMDEWQRLTDQKLPPEIYKMDFEEVEIYLRKKISQLGKG